MLENRRFMSSDKSNLNIIECLYQGWKIHGVRTNFEGTSKTKIVILYFCI